MRWFLILFVFIFDFVCIFTIIKAPLTSKFYHLNRQPDTIDNITSFKQDIIKTYDIKRRKRHLITGNERIRWKHGYLTRSAIRKHKIKHRKHHHHKYEKYDIILKCPTLPLKEPKLTTKIGVEWSHDSQPYLRIISTGKRFESVFISKVEEWKTISGHLNVIAYGPKPNDTRYKFEYEEAKGWFAMKMKNIKAEDVGIWQCKVKLKYPNSTILQFESRKKIYLENNIPKFKNSQYQAIVTSKSSYFNQKPINSKIKQLSTTTVKSTVSEPPLFMFSKNDGETTVFSRVDKRRDLLAYVRTDYKNDATSKNDKKKRFNYCSGASDSTSIVHIEWIFYITFIYYWHFSN